MTTQSFVSLTRKSEQFAGITAANDHAKEVLGATRFNQLNKFITSTKQVNAMVKGAVAQILDPKTTDQGKAELEAITAVIWLDGANHKADALYATYCDRQKADKKEVDDQEKWFTDLPDRTKQRLASQNGIPLLRSVKQLIRDTAKKREKSISVEQTTPENEGEAAKLAVIVGPYVKPEPSKKAAHERIPMIDFVNLVHHYFNTDKMLLKVAIVAAGNNFIKQKLEAYAELSATYQKLKGDEHQNAVKKMDKLYSEFKAAVKDLKF